MSVAPRKPDTMLETHDRLRGEGFGIVSLISARRVMESRAYFTQWLTARQRSIVVACLKDNNIEKFFIRTGASTTELSLSQMQDFVKQRFLSH